MTFAPTVQRALDADLLTMERVEDVPTPPLAYGRDLSCVTDCTADFAEVDPNSPLGIAQAVLRRWITPRGGLIDDADYGCNVRGNLNRGTTRQELLSLETRCINEAMKDERVATIDVAVTMNAQLTEITIRGAITPADADVRPFQFVFAVTSADALIQTIG